MSTGQSSDGSAQLAWFKSSHSSDEGGACVEIATSDSAVHVRDSKNTQGPGLTLPPAAWAAFLTYAKKR